MDNTAQTNHLQEASALCQVPLEIIPKLLWHKRSWGLVRTALALQQTCSLWNNRLNKDTKKNIIRSIFFNGEDFNETDYAKLTLKAPSTHERKKQNIELDEEQTIEAIKETAPELYLFAGADISYSANTGANSLLMNVVEVLDPYARPYTTLYLAALIRMKANVNYQDASGNTALHCAVSNNAVHCVELLLLAQADVNLKNKEQKKPHDWFMPKKAYILEHSERIQQLLSGEITPQESINKPLREWIKDDPHAEHLPSWDEIPESDEDE